jgi:excisionase family DNA binding protein
MTERFLTIGKAAEYLGIHKATVNRWQAQGILHPVYTPGGHRRFRESELRAALKLDATSPPERMRAIVYARVSTRKQADAGDLQRQKERLVTQAVERGYQVEMVLSEIASGLNERRSQLRKALKHIADGQAEILVVEFQDRLARFGYEYLNLFVTSCGGRIEVLESREDKTSNKELVEDLIAIVTSYSARIYGKRGGRVARQVSQTLKGSLQGDAKDDNPSDSA